MKHKVYKKGDLVKVTQSHYNASQFTLKIKNAYPTGVYALLRWEHIEFEIEGTVKLCTYDHAPQTYGAYLLLYKGKKVGYVYNNAIKKAQS